MGCLQSNPSTSGTQEEEEPLDHASDVSQTGVSKILGSATEKEKSADENKDYVRVELLVSDKKVEESEEKLVCEPIFGDYYIYDVDKDTQLLLANSFHYALRSCLLKGDSNWVLCMLDIDDLASINEKLKHDGANHKIREIGQIIKGFVDNNPRKFHGFRYFYDGKSDLFAILIHCRRQLQSSENLMRFLLTKVNERANETMSVGLAKIDLEDSFKEWRNRGMENLRIAKDGSGNNIYSDINTYKTNTTDEKESNEEILGNNDAFMAKIKSICQNEDENWIIAILDADNLGQYKFENGKEAANDETIKIEKEIYDLCNTNIDSNSNSKASKKVKKYFGYKLHGDEFALVLYDDIKNKNSKYDDEDNKDSDIDINTSSKSESNTVSGAHLMIERLLHMVGKNCNVTISVGFSRLLVQQEEIAEQWYERTDKYLSTAKENGRNQAYGGPDVPIITGLPLVLQTGDKTGADGNWDGVGVNVNNTDESTLNTEGRIKLNPHTFDMEISAAQDFGLIVTNAGLGSLEKLDAIGDSKWKTPHLKDTGEVTFDRLYKETQQFLIDNGRLEYLKRSRKVKKCSVVGCENSESVFDLILCSDHRTRLAGEFHNVLLRRGCMTAETSAIIVTLNANDEKFLNEAKQFIAKPFYFSNIYSYILWQQDALNQLSKNKFATSVSEFLFIVHAYLSQVQQLLILFHCYFDWKFISIFYPWICKAIGNNATHTMFFEHSTSDGDGDGNGAADDDGWDDNKEDKEDNEEDGKNDVDDDIRIIYNGRGDINNIIGNRHEQEFKASDNDSGLGVVACQMTLDENTSIAAIKEFSNSISKLFKCVSVFRESIYDIIHTRDLTTIKYTVQVELKLQQMVHNITSKETMLYYAQSFQNDELKSTDTADFGLDMEDDDIELKLLSQDMQVFTIKKDIAMMSAMIKAMWTGDKTETRIPLPNIRGTILKKVVIYMEYHYTNPPKEIEKPLKSANMREVVSEWDADFVEVDQETLFELILAANYLDIKPLLDLTCAKVASMIKGKTPQEIRQRFNLQNEFSPEEEEAIRAENKWAEDS